MVDFAGWEMPVQFSGLINEHNAVRNKSGVFDISHMGVFLLKGQNPKDAIQNLVPTDLFRIGAGEACYTVLLNKEGGIIDDLIIYDLGCSSENEENILLILNAGNTKSDVEWIKQNIDLTKLSITDFKNNGILLALQGPKAIEILKTISNSSISEIPRFGHRNIKLDYKESKDLETVFVARTGYTGEEGFELLLSSETGKYLWEKLIQKGVEPCGLGARDTLRLEAGMHLYGNDLNSETSPLEAGLGWLVHMEMPVQFIGREALEKQIKKGINKRLVGLELEGRGIPRKGYSIFHQNKKVGEITSGSWSPSLKKGIGMGYLPINLSKLGTKLTIEIRNKSYPATVVKKPFYRKIS